jgi:hypothetical protein
MLNCTRSIVVWDEGEPHHHRSKCEDPGVKGAIWNAQGDQSGAYLPEMLSQSRDIACHGEIPFPISSFGIYTVTTLGFDI